MTKRTTLVMIAVMALVMGTVIASGCVRIPATSVTPAISITTNDSNLHVISFNQALTTLEVLQKIDGAGLEPAALEEVMKDPKRATAKDGLIYALGSAGTLPVDARVCYTVPGCPDHDPVMSIDVKMFCDAGYKWPAGTNFGAMPK